MGKCLGSLDAKCLLVQVEPATATAAFDVSPELAVHSDDSLCIGDRTALIDKSDAFLQ